MARLWTPKELLERGEMEIGEEARVGDVLVSRDAGHTRLLTGKYHAYRSRHGYLQAGGTWARTTGTIHDATPWEGQGDWPGYFDSLPELLDALFVATLREEPSRTPEVAHVER